MTCPCAKSKRKSGSRRGYGAARRAWETQQQYLRRLCLQARWAASLARQAAATGTLSDAAAAERMAERRCAELEQQLERTPAGERPKIECGCGR